MPYEDWEQDEIRADLTNMYRAGKEVLPQRATHVAGVADRMTTAIASANTRSAQMGDHQVLTDVLWMAADCQAGMAATVTTINNLALAVVAQADDFRDRDDFARSVFNGLEPDLQGPPDPLPTAPSTVDQAETTEDGSPDAEANPDVQSPEEELEDRDLELDAYQNFGGED
ncbi:hypothetical protein [Nocardioides astragali]|uniref:YbaB/EbfC family DNA-binding protein n=1 Tax=Nocardioides astragali TaxID=1776736 RepID=A0ABW2N1T3_9ACTN|nr:hypothetical protein [Nocardioides astragali]